MITFPDRRRLLVHSMGPILVGLLWGCANMGGGPRGDVTFETARLTLVSEADTAVVEAELACTEDEQEVGLSGRSELAPDAGMLFVFDPVRPDTEGFWMWRTLIPLDIAFIGREGEVLAILQMDPCPSRDSSDCPRYIPGVEHAYALEVNQGWFEAHGVDESWRLADPVTCPVD